MQPDFQSYPFVAKQYQTFVPNLTDGAEIHQHAVAIIGGGPVGLALALGLARYKIPSVLIEADHSVCSGSRAICISRRSLEIIERLGALESFLGKGLPWTGGRSFYRDAEVLHFAMPDDDNQRLPPMLNIAQYHIEQYLLDAAEKQADLIDIRWQTRLTAIEQKSKGASLQLSAPGGSYRMHADWVVACDGGRSSVREALGLQLQGTSYEGRYVIVDIRLKSNRSTERLAYFDPPCNPGSTVLVHKQPDDVWRIDYQLRDKENAQLAVLPENVLPRVQSLLDMMGEQGEWAPIWITIYKANALTLERYRHERVLFAGDAAHLVPIFGVRGANSGIDDADNLAWKLAFTVKNLASEHILDSYSEERVFAAHENLNYGTKSTEFMAPPSLAFELMRQAVLGLAIKHPQVRSLINPRQSSAITYTTSPLQAGVASDQFSSGPVPGAVVQECPILIEEFGQSRYGYLTEFLTWPGFTALHFSTDLTTLVALDDLTKALKDEGIPFRVIQLTSSAAGNTRSNCLRGLDYTGRLFPMYAETGGAVYLVRPDGHILGRWHIPDFTTMYTAVGHALYRTRGITK